MQKVTVTVPQSGKWQGLRTKYPFDSALVTPDHFLIGSKNFNTTVDGAITKRPGGAIFNTSPLTTPIKDQYEVVFADGSRHLIVVQDGTISFSAGGAISTATGGTGFSTTGNFEFASYQDRVYADNGVDNPIVYDKTVTYGGVTYTNLPKIRPMGATVPASAPTAPAAGSGATGSVPNGVHTYKVTYLYYDSEESNGSSASGVCTVVAPASTVALTAIPVGGYGVTARKIYRDNNDGLWLLVGTIANNTATTFNDTAAVGTAIIPFAHNLPPKFSLTLPWHDRIFVAGIPSLPFSLAWSDPGFPDIFNPFNILICNPKDPITALYVYNDRIIVFNRHSIGQILGSTSATFQYSEITSAIGCVDNRSVQIRTSTGVPVLMWLADKGFYQFNGSSIEYISDDIEDQMILNIQQGSSSRGRHSDDTEADFEAGTETPGIIVADGQVTTINPVYSRTTQAQWQEGVIDNLATLPNNSLTLIQDFSPAFTSGTFGGSAFRNTGNNRMQLPVHEDSAQNGLVATTLISTSSVTNVYRAQSPIIPYASHLQAITALWSSGGPFTTVASITVRNQAGTVVFSQSFSMAASGGSHTFTMNVAIAAGQYFTVDLPSFVGQFPSSCNWFAGADDFSRSGTWTSPEYDTFSVNPTFTFLEMTALYQAGAGSTIEIFGTNTSGSGYVSLASYSDQTSTFSVAGQYPYQYILIVYTLTATAALTTPYMTQPSLDFNRTGVWISPVIDLTTDATAFRILSGDTEIQGIGTISFRIATSTDNVTYSAFTTINSATIHRYAKIKITITDSGLPFPIVFNTSLIWEIVSTFTSQVVNIGYIPSGWNLFIPEFTIPNASHGSIDWYVRSGASSAACLAASWVAIDPGDFIPGTAAQYIQYKAVFTVDSDNVEPLIEAVTLNWTITNQQSIRVASLFFDRTYYMAVAEFGSTYNNVLYKYSYDNTWKRDEDLAINTFSLFFDEPYYGSSIDGKLVLFSTATTDFGTNITMDIRTVLKVSARTPGDLEDKMKVLRDITANVVGTGATYVFQYSIDQGTTWITMQNVANGLMYFTPANDNQRHFVRMAPILVVGQPYASNRSILLRVTDGSQYTAEVRNIKAHLWIRNQEVVEDTHG